MDPMALRAARPKDSGVSPIDTNINKLYRNRLSFLLTPVVCHDVSCYVLVGTVIKLHDTRF